MEGQSGRDRFRLMAVVRWGPSTLAKRSTVTSVPGLSSEKSRTRLSASRSVRSTSCLAGPLRGVSSWNVLGSRAEEPYTSVEDFTTMCRTEEPEAPAAARRFIVPITLISWRRAMLIPAEFVTMKVWRMVSTCVAFTMRLRIE